ncbi:MAG: carboxymuconolactone decarboxylase family protein [Planctomycetia bacterium]|nr:carboxymuconolactone decarboxylase family protein [Planctomycetia bacterium]
MDNKAENTTAKGPSAINATVAELMAVAAAVAAGFEAGVEYHVNAGRKAGLTDEDLVAAANVGLKLRQASMESTVHSARELLAPGGHTHEQGGCGCGQNESQEGGCCSDEESNEGGGCCGGH